LIVELEERGKVKVSGMVNGKKKRRQGDMCAKVNTQKKMVWVVGRLGYIEKKMQKKNRA